MATSTRLFSGSLNTNEFYDSLYNAYRLAMTYANNLSGLDSTLADRYRADGGMYADQVVYTDLDVAYSQEWDPTDTNVLEPEYKVAPQQEKITVNQMRQIGLYTDEYLSKRAWMDASSYDGFRSVVQKQVIETKRVYEQKLVDTYAGSLYQTNVELPLPTDTNAEAQNRLRATAIAKEIGNLMVDLKDSTRNYNTYGFMKSFDESDFDIIWNADYFNEIRYTDLPTIFHTENLIKNGHVLPSHYFGVERGSSETIATAGGFMAADEYFIPVGEDGKYAAPDTATKAVHVFPGDILPEGTLILQHNSFNTPIAYVKKSVTISGMGKNPITATVKLAKHARCFKVQPKIICKVVHKDAIKYLSSFETQTEFWNPKNLSTNRYLTWAFAFPDNLRGYPCISITEKTQA